ncbi:MAG: VCBS repeat-containing protein [Deltaproteobacteria bacterium]|nr:VCBS repeat-containing protein [Deltaproteobacteria bacterium]
MRRPPPALAALTFLFHGCAGKPALPGEDEAAVAEPITPLADIPGAPVGPFRGTFDVDRNGAATYRLPLELPPGRAGVTPELALAYSSNAGHGALGVGWSLEGLTRISRCASFPALHGLARAVQLDGQDRFCLNGQPLVDVVRTTSRGDLELRTEEDALVRVLAFGNGRSRSDAGWDIEHFEVHYPDGRIADLGASADSRVLSPTGKTRAWSITRLRDRRGNSMQIRYAKPRDPGHPALAAEDPEQVVSDIAYTKSEGSISGTPLAPNRSVTFTYDTHELVARGFAHGGVFVSSKRLREIAVSVDQRLERRYLLEYQSSRGTRRSLLKSVKRCNASGVCLPPLSFEYTDRVVAFSLPEAVSEPTIGRWSQTFPPALADFNGDGRADFLRAVVDDRSEPPTIRLSVRYGSSQDAVRFGPPLEVDAWSGPSQGLTLDFDGDGLMDVLVRSRGNQFPWVWLRGSPQGLLSPQNLTADSHSTDRFADFDGDGFTDFAACRGGAYEIAFGRGGTLFGTPIPVPGGACNSVPSATSIRSTISIDLDGDGAQELITSDIAEDEVTTAVVSLRGRTPIRQWWTSGPRPALGFLNLATVADINGDGLSDLTVAQPEPPYVTQYFVPSRGGDLLRALTQPAIMLRQILMYPSAPGDWHPFAADFNGDAKADFVNSIVGGYLLGQTKDPFAATDLDRTDERNVIQSGTAWPVPLFGDLDGNGSVDLLWVKDTGIEIVRQVGGPQDLLRSVREGKSTSVTLTHQALSNRSVYTPGACNATAPALCVYGGPTPVVSTVEFDAGPKLPARHFDYRYEDARRDRSGRGWLGFGRIVKIEPARNASEEWVYDQGSRQGGRYPYADRVKRHTRIVRVASPSSPGLSLLVDVEETDWATASTDTLSYRVYPRRTVVEHHERGSWPCSPTFSDCRPVTRTTRHATRVDALGFALEEQVYAADGLSTETTWTYDHDLGEWLLGRPRTRATVRSITGGGSAHQSMRWTYDPLTGRVASEQIRGDADPDRLISRFSYDTFGNLTRVEATSAQGDTRATTVDYGDAARMFPTTITNALGHVTRATPHPAFGAPLTIVGPNNEGTRVGYDQFGRIARLIRADGTTTTWTYAVAPTTTSASYTVTVAPQGESPVTFDVDRLDRVIRRSWIGYDGRSYQELSSFDRFGRQAIRFEPMAVGDSAKGWTAWVFDEAGRLRAQLLPDGQAWEWVYALGLGSSLATREAQGSAVTTYDPNHHAETRYHDGRGLIERTVDAEGGVTLYEYGPLALPRAITDPINRRTTIELDDYGRRKTLIDPTLGTERFVHTAFGELRQHSDAAGTISTFQYDAIGRLVRREQGAEISTWRYDQPISVCPACSAHAIGRLVSATGPDGHATEWGYDAFGRLSSETRVIGGAAYRYTQSYDTDGRLAVLTYPSTPDGFALAVRQSYTNGVLARLDDPATGFVYWQRVAADASGRTTRELFGNGVTSSRRFTPGGALAELDAKSSTGGSLQGLAYDYDRRGNMIARRDLLQEMTERFTYDRLDRLTEACFADGITPVLPPPSDAPGAISGVSVAAPWYPASLTGLPAVSAKHQFPPLQPAVDLQRAAWRASARSPLVTGAEAELVRAAGVVLSREGSVPWAQTSYTRCSSFRYDPAGNFTERSDVGRYDYPASAGGRPLAGAPRQITPQSGVAVPITYDVRGQITGLGSDRFAFSPGGLLRRVISTALPLETTFEYDADGRRVRKQSAAEDVVYAGTLYEEHEMHALTSPLQALPATTWMSHHFLVADGRVVAEIRHHVDPLQVFAVRTSQAPWVAASSAQAPALSVEALSRARGLDLTGTHTAFYLHSDGLGSVELVTDAFGQPVERRSYAPFGRLRSPDWKSGRAPIGVGSRPVGFTGHEDDVELGLVNMTGRVYHAGLGRFLTPDPLIQAPLFSQSLNRYSYVFNQPLSRTDPSGFESEPVEMPPEIVTVETGPREPIMPGDEPAHATEQGDPSAPWTHDFSGMRDRWVDNAADHFFTMSDFVLGLREGVLPFPEVGVQNGHEIAYGLGKMLGSGAGLVLDLQLTLASITTGLSGAASCGTGVLCVAGAPMAAVGALGATLAAGLSAAHVGKYVDGLDQIKKGRDYYAASGDVPKIHMGQQGKHLPHHNNFQPGRSVLRADPHELAKRAGTGTPVNEVPRGQPGFRERIEFEEVIGDFVKNGVAMPTRNAIIHYGKEGIHIVPAAP